MLDLSQKYTDMVDHYPLSLELYMNLLEMEYTVGRQDEAKVAIEVQWQGSRLSRWRPNVRRYSQNLRRALVRETQQVATGHGKMTSPESFAQWTTGRSHAHVLHEG